MILNKINKLKYGYVNLNFLLNVLDRKFFPFIIYTLWIEDFGYRDKN